MHDILLNYGFWIVLGIVLFISEAIVPTALLFFFGFGALFTALFAATNLELSLAMLLMLFSIFSVGFILLLRKTYKQWLVGHKTSANDGDVNSSTLIGESAVVMSAFIGSEGYVRLNGSSWNAACDDPANLMEGDKVKVVSISGNTLLVEKA